LSLTGLVFVLLFLAGCVAAFVRHPVYGLVTYIGVFYAHPPSRWWGQGLLLEVRWSLIAAGVALAAVLINRSRMGTAPMHRNGAFIGFLLFIGWIAIQSFWAKDPDAHAELLSYYLKFLVVMYLFCRTIDSEQSLRLVLWAHVLGCFYLGVIAYTSYSGGRFEGFGGPGINEANAASLQLVTGALVAGALFLASSTKYKVALLGIVPIIVNGIVTTISRSGFLAAAIGGIIFNLFTPARFRLRVRVLSVLALVLFALLTNPIYWSRIATIAHKGAEVEGVDTGAGRLQIIEVQFKMFKAYPLGCGHMCTTYLSPMYLDPSMLSEGARASHNTFMTMLVDHGMPGGIFYVAMVAWIAYSGRILLRRVRGEDGFLATVIPAVVAVLGAILVCDMFVQYPKFEARIWFVSLLIVMLHLTSKRSAVNVPP
jgi:hypothetical protein